MGKLWEKNYTINQILEKFTVGDDYLLDQNLVKSDCIGSIAHATMLTSIGILTQEELAILKKELNNIITLSEKGEFPITVSDEDCHTAIENYLTAQTGEVGKKIHTGRSRNDQILLTTRLFARDFLLQFKEQTLQLVEALLDLAEKNKETPMPGRTHMQIAMPSSVGLWAGAFAEGLLDDLKLVSTAFDLNNMSPLGASAGYGVPIPLNREMVSNLLGFEKVQNNVIYVHNSRGKTDSIILDALEQTVMTLSKMAQDLILFSLPEFGYFSLPDELCTGSSIMPQKKNPDGLELLRAKAGTLSGYNMQIKNIIRTLPTGYNRDYQETKRAFIEGINIASGCVRIAIQTIKKLKVNRENLEKAFTPEIYATDAALELVAKGMPFRDAYKEIGLNLNKLGSRNPQETIQAKTHTGTTGNLGLELSIREIDRKREENNKLYKIIEDKFISLAGRKVTLYNEM